MPLLYQRIRTAAWGRSSVYILCSPHPLIHVLDAAAFSQYTVLLSSGSRSVQSSSTSVSIKIQGLSLMIREMRIYTETPWCKIRSLESFPGKDAIGRHRSIACKRYVQEVGHFTMRTLSDTIIAFISSSPRCF